jgi:hypothetical protein
MKEGRGAYDAQYTWLFLVVCLFPGLHGGVCARDTSWITILRDRAHHARGYVMIPTLHIQLLGDFLLVSDDNPVTAGSASPILLSVR